MVSIRRHARHWRTYLACGGLGLVILAGPEITGAHPNPTAKQDTAAQAYGGSNAQKPTETLWERTEEDPVALYTFFLTVFTAALVGVSAVQIRFLVKADGIARETASTAALQARLAEKAFIANDRPWLIVEPVYPEQSGHWIVFIFRIVNYGNSVAFIQGDFSVITVPAARPSAKTIDAYPLSREPNITVPAGGKIDIITARVEDGANMDARKAKAFFIGRISYTGVKNIRHHTRFCWEYNSEDRKYYEAQYEDDLNERT